MSTFVDTSALLAVLDADDQNHAHADAVWRQLIEANEDIVCTHYVLVELFALVQARLGMAAIRVLANDVVPELRICWMEADSHRAAVTALLTAGRRRLSLVDCASFEAMRRLGIGRVFGFDPHFVEQGFELIP